MSAPAPPPFIEPYPGFSDENKGPLIVVVTASLTALALVFVVARLYSRLLSAGRLAVDDYIVILSIVLGITYVGMGGAAVHYGGGRHIATLEPWQVTNVIKLTVISFVPGVTSFVAPKFAVVILLAKLLVPSRIHIKCMWGMSAVYLLLTAGMLTINFAQCSPAAAQWGGAEGTCWDRRITVDYALTVGIVSVLFDFYLAIYPTIVLWQLQMNWKRKLAISSSLGFGYCAGAVTIYKCTTFESLIDLQDFTFALGTVVLWTNIEANCVLIGACIPTLFPLVKKLFGSGILGGSKAPGSAGIMEGRVGDSSNPLATIGSYPTGGKGGKKGRKTMSRFDDLDEEDNKYIILEERSFHLSTTELRAEDAVALDQGRGTKADGWIRRG